MAGEVGGEAGALDSDGHDLAVGNEPGQELLVSGRGGGELSGSQESALAIQRGRIVGVLVGVDAPTTSAPAPAICVTWVVVVHAGRVRPFPRGEGVTGRVGRQDSDGLLSRVL